MDPLENAGAPVIPAGTKTAGGFAYDPLKASILQSQGQGQPKPESPVATQASAPTGTTFAEIAAKKGFQSPDDLAKAYEALESHNKKVEMTAADIIKQVYEQPQQPVQQPVMNPQQGTDDAVKIVEGIVDARTKPLKEQIALQNLFIKSPDAKDYAVQLAQVVKENPGITWDNAYKLAKFDAAEQKAKEAGRAEAYQNIQQKQTVVAGSASPSQGRSGPDIRSIIKDRSVPFKEVDRMVREVLNAQQ